MFSEFRLFRVKIVFLSTIAAVLVGIMGRRFYLKKRQERDERNIRATLDKERRERRALTRNRDLKEDQLCVVCQCNPKEVSFFASFDFQLIEVCFQIIILPCGHVCICEDCSEKIRVNCPVCRGNIQTKAAAFIS